MYSSYNQQVEHVNSCSNKKHKITCEGIKSHFFIELYPLQGHRLVQFQHQVDRPLLKT
jgi:hypothetical protein